MTQPRLRSMMISLARQSARICRCNTTPTKTVNTTAQATLGFASATIASNSPGCRALRCPTRFSFADFALHCADVGRDTAHTPHAVSPFSFFRSSHHVPSHVIADSCGLCGPSLASLTRSKISKLAHFEEIRLLGVSKQSAVFHESMSARNAANLCQCVDTVSRVACSAWSVTAGEN